MTLRCLFVDFNSYFASVEQFDEPSLRGRPVAVVPVMAETTCCIAASVEAKRFGVRTGTLVREARALCPELAVVLARPSRYVEIHRALMDLIETCAHHEPPASIDEVACLLIGRERERDQALRIAGSIKAALTRAGFAPAIRCSIGIAPNRFLAKTASDMHKPDGLVVLEQEQLPQALHGLGLRDFCGIGASMEQRLHRAGIADVPALCAASRERLRRVWGSVEGERFWLQLRGHDLPERHSERASIGHSHVLGPELRDLDSARSVSFKLLAKAAMRLRREGFLAGAMAIRMRFLGLEKRFERDLRFAPIDDTPTLLHLLSEALQPLQRAAKTLARHPPLSVAVTLVDLRAAEHVGGDLFDPDPRGRRTSAVIDRINRKFGNNALYFGAMHAALTQGAAPMRIPFSAIPDPDLDADRPASPEELWLTAERRYKVMAESTHRRQRDSRNGSRQGQPGRRGA